MDDHEPRPKKRALSLSAAAAASTPSPARRRRRRLLTGSSPGCVPRAASGPAPSPSRALRTPPPRRLLPPTSAGRRANPASAMAPPPRVPRSAASSVLRLDDMDALDDDDDAFSVISGDGSPERDRHVLDFLSFNALADGAQGFTLFTPSPAASKTSSVTRSIKTEFTTGLLTPLASPVRAKKDVSPSHFFRSPYAKSRSNSTASSPASLRLSGRKGSLSDDDHDEYEPEPRRSVTRSPRTPQRGGDMAIKSEPMPDAIVCKLPEGARTSSTPSSSSIPWRRNSLSLMRTPSPAASHKAKALRARAQILRSTGKDPFADDVDDPSSAPSALQGTNDQDWLFSFANTLSPLAPGTVNDDDLESSFLTLRFSPAVPSSFDVQRLLPPFPSPGLGPRDPTAPSVPTPKTPSQPTERKSSSSPSSSTAPSSSSSRASRSSSSSSSSRDLNESFPNIRASTSATPGRDERLKVSSSSVMKMKLHVTFDQFPPSHTKREMEAINNSLKRKKQARKRKLDESKQRSMKVNSKGLNVQRKLLHTPTKEDPPVTAEEKKEVVGETLKVKPRQSKDRSATQSLKGRSAQRKLLDSVEEADDSCVKSVVGSARPSDEGSAVLVKQTLVDPEPSNNSLRRRLSPTLGSVSTPTLPTSLAGSVTTPNLHPLKLRKSPTAAKPTVAVPTATPAIETPTPKLSTKPAQKAAPPAPVKPMVSISADIPKQEPPQSVLASAPTLPSTTPVKDPVAPKLKMAITTPLTATTGGFAASAKLLTTPVQQSVPVNPAVAASQGPVGNPSKKVHCNCKKSKCLKLYCECFANGEYCDELCNCVSCCNSPAHESVRQQAITSRLEKNPNAFKPKIELTVVTMTPGGATPARMIPGFTTPHNDHRHGHHHAHGKGELSGDLKKMHKHGCHCKKSGCQKRYCECFQAGVPCGENCRCIDCKNHSPYVAKNAGVATPLSAINGSGPGARELVRGSVALAAAATPDANGDQFVSPSLPSVRQRLRIDRETWARNFSSPFEVSPRRERERTERFRAQMKSSRASALLRSFNGANAATTQPIAPEVTIKTEPGVVVAATPSTLSFRVSTTPSFTSPPGQSVTLGGPKPPRSLSPLSDAARPPPAPKPYGKDARSRHTKRFVPYNPHALEALSIGRKTPGRVYVLPLFGNDLPPVKMEVGAKIFHFLTNADVYNASLVNRLWSRVTMGDSVWDHHNFRRLPPHLLTAANATHHPDDGDVEMQQG